MNFLGRMAIVLIVGVLVGAIGALAGLHSPVLPLLGGAAGFVVPKRLRKARAA